nr:hypothetical protein [Salinispora cortesiana]
MTVFIGAMTGQVELRALTIIGGLVGPALLVGSVVRAWKEPA